MKVTAIIISTFGLFAATLLTGCQSPSPISFASFEPSAHTTTTTTLTSQTTQVSNPHVNEKPGPKRSLITLGKNEELSKLVREAPGVVLVDFYADWCGPCKKQGAVLKELEQTATANKALMVKVNVDKHPELAKKFQVAALPTILVLKEGKIVDRQKGLSSRAKITSLLKR